MTELELELKLMEELNFCEELDSCNIEFVKLDTINKKIIVSFDYAAPEVNKLDTIFCNY